LTSWAVGQRSTDHEIDPEVYPLKLEIASEEEPEDWKMECCICDRPLDYVNVPMPRKGQGISRDVNISELARNKFVEEFADGYGLIEGTRHRAWDLYLEWLERAMMAENIRYSMEAGGYGPGFAVGMCARGDD
jgi:hypothetical protein